MTEPTIARRKRPWFWIGFAVMGLAGIAGLSRIISIAIEKVASGRGYETYRTVWLVEFSYIGVLILFGVIILALLVAGGMAAYEWSLWRSLEKKYGERGSNT